MERSVPFRPNHPAAASASGQLGSRLDSWKEIASYLGRSEKTVRRWEEREELPVHRLLHEKRGSVYAYESELDTWREARKPVIELSDTRNEHRLRKITVLKPPTRTEDVGWPDMPLADTVSPAVTVSHAVNGLGLGNQGTVPDADGMPRRLAGDRGRIARFLKWHNTAGIAIGAAVALAIGVVWFVSRPPPRPTGELSEQRLTFNSSENPVLRSSISPDGKYLAYSDFAGLHVRLLSTGEERSIATPAGVPSAALSYVDGWFPDGTRLLAHSKDGTGRGSIWTVSIMGQALREVRADASGWEVSPEGNRIVFSPNRAFADAREIWVMGSQGDNPQKVLEAEAGEGFSSVHWSPDGRRLAYIRSRYPRQFVETCDLEGGNRTAVVDVSESDPWVQDFVWLRDGRIVYSQIQWPESQDADLWQIGLNTHSGMPVGKAKRITHSADSSVGDLSATAAGTRLVLRKFIHRAQVYVSDLAAGGTRLSASRRLTNDEADDQSADWTADSKSVLFTSGRNGKAGVFKQVIGQSTVEPLVTGREALYTSRLSPDGKWVVYVDAFQAARDRVPIYRIMRVPVGGGMPQLVFETTQNWANYNCSRATADYCAILVVSRDAKSLILTGFDPLKGKGKVLRTIENDPGSTDPGTPACWQFQGVLSPDGSTFAIARKRAADIHIRLLSLAGGPDREITVRDWPNISGLDWSADGKGLYCGVMSPQGNALLYVDLNGRATVAWQSRGIASDLAAVPSPDGRHLAMWRYSYESNVWMVEGY